MTNNSEKMRRKLSDAIDTAFREKLKTAVLRKFGFEIETTYNIFVMGLESRRVNGEDFSERELDYIQAFEAGYIAAWDVATKAVIGQAKNGEKK